MDVRLFAAVVSRFKKIAIAGLVAAIALSALAYLRAGGAPTWEAQSEVLITQANDPYGAPTAAAMQASSYLGSLSSVYSAMANGDAVQATVRRAAGVPQGAVDAAEVVDPQTGYLEPLLTLTSSAATAAGAVKLAQQMPAVLQQYISSQQDSANVPTGLRVKLEQVKSGFLPELASGSSITVPLLVFMGIMAAVITLIFMLENLNPKTAEKLGRVNGTMKGTGQAASDLAAVLTALVQNQQPDNGPAPPHPGTPNGHGGGPQPQVANFYSTTGSQASAGGPQDAGARTPAAHGQPRALRLYEDSSRGSHREDFSTDGASADPARQALRKRLLRGRE